jgi:hypothetical protein
VVSAISLHAHGEPFDSPLILSLSKDEQLAQDRPFDSPLILSLSKDERLAQDRPRRTMSPVGGSSFDKLKTSGVQKRHAQETSASEANSNCAGGC